MYHLSERVRSPENWSHDVWQMSSSMLYYATLQPILQPTETESAYKINLRRIIGVGCKIGQDAMAPWYGKAPRGNDERIGQKTTF